MDLLKTGKNFGQTIKNVGRLKEIIGILAKNGLAEFISRGVTANIPDFVLPESTLAHKEELKSRDKEDWHGIIGMRLRKSFEELGPFFIKFGQLLSSREDVFQPAFIKEMKLLQDRANTVPFAEVKNVIENSLLKKLNTIFSTIDEKPLGMASIGVVHKAVLLDGTTVVVKVRRPNIARIVDVDSSILFFLISNMEKFSEELRFIGLSRMITDFSLALTNELNFNIEALNCARFKSNIEAHDTNGIFHIPKIFTEYSSDAVIVMEYIDGVPFTSNKIIEQHKEEVTTKILEGVPIIIKNFLQDGFFHADLHCGNFFLLRDGRIAIIDYGLMGTLSKKSRITFTAIIYSILNFNYENMVYEFLDVAEYEKLPNIDILIADVRSALSPFVGLSVGQANFSQVLNLIIGTLVKHQLYLPQEWFVIFRALITLDGVGKNLKIKMNLFEMLEGDIKEILKTSISKEDMIENALWMGKDILLSLRMLPRHIKWYLREWGKNNYAFEVRNRGYENELASIANALKFLGFALVSAVLVYVGVLRLEAGYIKTWHDIPVFSIGAWALAFFLFIRGYWFIRK